MVSWKDDLDTIKIALKNCSSEVLRENLRGFNLEGYLAVNTGAIEFDNNEYHSSVKQNKIIVSELNKKREICKMIVQELKERKKTISKTI